LVVCMVLITGSLAEELMFRGYPFQRLVEAVGPAGAIMVFAAMFGLVHLSNPGSNVWGLLNTVAIGVFLSLAFLRTRALWMPWGFHFAWNTTMGLLLGLPVSGLRLFNVAVHATASGPKWLTGGSYGLEASASGVLAIAIGFFVIWRLPLRSLSGAMPFLPPTEQQRPDLSKLST
jgi:CAAX protease family protein